jgi:hypothetical protein
VTTAEQDIEKLEGPKLRGWKEIADYLEVSVRRAQERARQAVLPLPVRRNHRGPWMYVSVARDWVHATDMAWIAHQDAKSRQAETGPEILSSRPGANRRDDSGSSGEHAA